MNSGGTSRPYALLVPGASAHRPEKRWPVERFAELGEVASAVAIAAETARNFNANAGPRSEDERIAASVALMEAAW